MAIKRIQKELADINKNPNLNFSAGPVSNSNLFLWQANLKGPEGSPYEGGLFSIRIDLPVPNMKRLQGN